MLQPILTLLFQVKLAESASFTICTQNLSTTYTNLRHRTQGNDVYVIILSFVLYQFKMQIIDPFYMMTTTIILVGMTALLYM
jgi:hypothetical protein